MLVYSSQNFGDLLHAFNRPYPCSRKWLFTQGSKARSLLVMTGLMLFWWQAHSSEKPPPPPEGRTVRMGRETMRSTVQTTDAAVGPDGPERRPFPYPSGGQRHHDVGGHSTTGSCQCTTVTHTTSRGPSPTLKCTPTVD